MAARAGRSILDGVSLIAADGLSIGHGARVLVTEIEFDLAGGEVLCLLGPNGVGKTTLFRTLLGLQTPLTGSVRLGGRPLGALSRAEIARAVAYVPQSLAAPFAFTLMDLVLMGRTAHLGAFDRPRPEDHAAAAAALSTLGLGALADAEVTAVSGGQRQLALIARAVAQGAQAIVMDEPTASLDFGNRLRVLAEIRRLAERGLGVIISTHDPTQALAVAKSVALMTPAASWTFGPAGEMLTSDRLSATYGVGLVVERTEKGRMAILPESERARESY